MNATLGRFEPIVAGREPLAEPAATAAEATRRGRISSGRGLARDAADARAPLARRGGAVSDRIVGPWVVSMASAGEGGGGSGRPRSVGPVEVRELGVEEQRLQEDGARKRNWKRWGPYLSERQWGTVREDYSAGRRLLGLLPARPRPQPRLPLGRGRPARHHATASAGCASRSRCGTARDPILKERLFGLTGPEGNHGEDVKEAYFYLDSTPTHSYMKALYKYPQAEFPYARLVEENRRRGRDEPRVRARRHRRLRRRAATSTSFAEYAKASPDDILIRITVANRGAGGGDAAPAADALVPQHLVVGPRAARATAEAADAAPRRRTALRAEHATLGRVRASSPAPSPAGGARSCCSPRTRPTRERLFGVAERDALREGRVPRVRGRTAARDAVNPARTGTKAAALLPARDPGRRAEVTLRLRLCRRGRGADAAVRRGLRRDRSTQRIARGRRVLRGAHARRRSTRRGARASRGRRYAGLLWSKQFYHYVVKHWLEGDPAQPAPPAERAGGPQRRVAAPLQPRRHLDAGQVGVPVVRGVGPGVPHDPVRRGRPGVRQGAAAAVPARVVHAPERPDPGLRVRLRRRQPAGARLGLLARLQDDRRARRARPRCSSSASSRSCCSTSPGG